MTTWAIDLTHSTIQFSVKHLGISTVRGTFGQFEGTITEDQGIATAAAISIDMTTINTGNAQRDGHLQSPDFFDAAQFPKAEFALTKFERSGDDVTATGMLTMHGQTHPVTLTGEVSGPAKDPWGNTKIAATLAGKVSRAQWGLTWNAAIEAGGVLVSDDVKLAIDLQAAAQA